jgi:flagellin-like protein
MRDRRRWRSRRRGVSDVIATILLLGITVSLFSAIFLFVNKFPKPLPQGTDQFQASLILNASSTSNVYGVKVTLGAGPSIGSGAVVYLVPAKAVAGNWQFTQTKGIPIRWGLNNTTTSWFSGQQWFTKFKVQPTLPNNITVDVVASSTLLFQVVLTGGSVNSPPVISQVWTNRTAPQVGQGFTINALLTGNLKGATATIYLGGIPGLPKTAQAFPINTGTGLGSYSVSGGATTASGSFLAFIQGNNSAGQTFSASVPITIVSATTGTNPTVSVSISVSPSPVLDRTNESLLATVTNSGLSSVTLSSAIFYVNFTNNATWTHIAKFVVVAGLPTVPSQASATFSPSTPWMPPPNVTQSMGQVNLTVAISVGGSSSPVGSRFVYVAPAPFKAKVQSPQLISLPPAGPGSYWNIPISVTNVGSLGGSLINITVYVNQSGGSAVGTEWFPAPLYGRCFGSACATPLAVAYATPNATNFPTMTTLPSGATIFGSFVYLGSGTAATLVVTALVTVTNSAWTGLTPTKLTLKVNLTFTT